MNYPRSLRKKFLGVSIGTLLLGAAAYIYFNPKAKAWFMKLIGKS